MSHFENCNGQISIFFVLLLQYGSFPKKWQMYLLFLNLKQGVKTLGYDDGVLEGGKNMSLEVF